MIRDQIILQKNYNSLGIKCFACKQNNHIALDCPYLHHKPDHDRIIKMHVFNPQQKFRRKFKRKVQRSHDALGTRIPIKLSCLKFRDYLKANHSFLLEATSEIESLESIEDITDREIVEYEKYKTVLTLEEENKKSVGLNMQSLFFEKPAISITRIKDEEEIEINCLDTEKPLLNTFREQEKNEEMVEENRNIDQDEEKTKKQIKLFKNPTGLSIDTGLSIVKRAKNKSVSSKDEEKISIKTSSFEREKKVEKEENQGSMVFQFEGINIENFNNKKLPEVSDSFDSFNSLRVEGRRDRKSSKGEKSKLDRQSSKNSWNKNPLHLGKQMSLKDPLQKKNSDSRIPKNESTTTVSYNKPPKKELPIIISNNIQESNKEEKPPSPPKIPKLNRPDIKMLAVSTPLGQREKPPKSALLRKWNATVKEEIELIRSPLLKKLSYCENPKSEDKDKNGEVGSKKENLADNFESFSENADMTFETVRIFKNYFPMSNVDQVILKIVWFKRQNVLKREKRRKTKKFGDFFPEKNKQLRKSFDVNKIVPMTESAMLGMDMLSSRLSSPKMQDRRASNIFIERVNTTGFFKKQAIKYTFYDIVYEVLNNKELRKVLYSIKEKSKKVKIHKKLTNME